MFIFISICVLSNGARDKNNPAHIMPEADPLLAGIM
jgi:hypothetical protein